MPDVLDSARSLIESRIAEIDDEAEKLRSALTNLGSGGRPARVSKAKAPSPRRRKGKRARRGQRREEFLAAVKSNPGAPAADLGRAMGVSTNQAYALGQRLLKDGEVRKSGKGFRPAKKE